MIRALIACWAMTTCTAVAGADEVRGYHRDVQVTAATRLDWVYAVANQSPASIPDGWLANYESTEQNFELYVPRTYNKRRAWPVVIFVSPSDKAMGFRHWRKACEELGIIFAGPHGAGNNCDTRERIRIVLDVLDEVRRNYHTDVDRTYISGFSGGGRIACAIGFSLPAHFGGVVPVCAAGDLRQESWLRHRVIDRLSVAHVTGETDFNRAEVERFRGPILADVGVRTRTWVVSKLGHAMPAGDQLLEVARYLDSAVRERKTLARKYAATSIPGDQAPSRQQRAKQLFAEAKLRLEKKETVYSGLMLAKGVMVRWPDLPEAAEAKAILLKHDGDADAQWQNQDVAEQRKFLIARARGLTGYASGPLPRNYAAQRGNMAQAALGLWQQVIADGQDEAAVAEGRRQIPELRQILKDAEK